MGRKYKYQRVSQDKLKYEINPNLNFSSNAYKNSSLHSESHLSKNDNNSAFILIGHHKKNNNPSIKNEEVGKNEGKKTVRLSRVEEKELKIAIIFAFKNIFHSPDPTHWGGKNGTISRIREHLKIPREKGYFRSIKETLTTYLQSSNKNFPIKVRDASISTLV